MQGCPEWQVNYFIYPMVSKVLNIIRQALRLLALPEKIYVN